AGSIVSIIDRDWVRARSRSRWRDMREFFAYLPREKGDQRSRLGQLTNGQRASAAPSKSSAPHRDGLRSRSGCHHPLIVSSDRRLYFGCVTDQFGPRGYAELHEHLAQVVLDGPGTQEELCGDFLVRQTLADELHHLQLLWCQLGERVRIALVRR